VVAILGLALVIVKELFAAIRQITASGTTIQLMKRNTRLALTVAVDLHLLYDSRIAFSEQAEAVDLDRLHDLNLAGESQER
jgi:branched-chain amino acid transport system ATP-binding protein